MHEWTLASAIRYLHIEVREEPYDQEKYRSACEFVIANRKELTQRVYIELPGGRSGNSDPAWAAVKDSSVSRCGCGNERTIYPENQEMEFEPSDREVIISEENTTVYLKPIGGDQASAVVKLELIPSGLAMLPDPFAPFVFTLDVFVTQGCKLENLARQVSAHGPQTLGYKGKGVFIPYCQFLEIDPDGRTVKIMLDNRLEVFEPLKEELHSVECCMAETGSQKEPE